MAAGSAAAMSSSRLSEEEMADDEKSSQLRKYDGKTGFYMTTFGLVYVKESTDTHVMVVFLGSETSMTKEEFAAIYKSSASEIKDWISYTNLVKHAKVVALKQIRDRDQAIVIRTKVETFLDRARAAVGVGDLLTIKAFLFYQDLENNKDFVLPLEVWTMYMQLLEQLDLKEQDSIPDITCLLHASFNNENGLTQKWSLAEICNYFSFASILESEDLSWSWDKKFVDIAIKSTEVHYRMVLIDGMIENVLRGLDVDSGTYCTVHPNGIPTQQNNRDKAFTLVANQLMNPGGMPAFDGWTLTPVATDVQYAIYATQMPLKQMPMQSVCLFLDKEHDELTPNTLLLAKRDINGDITCEGFRNLHNMPDSLHEFGKNAKSVSGDKLVYQLSKEKGPGSQAHFATGKLAPQLYESLKSSLWNGIPATQYKQKFRAMKRLLSGGSDNGKFVPATWPEATYARCHCITLLMCLNSLSFTAQSPNTVTYTLADLQEDQGLRNDMPKENACRDNSSFFERTTTGGLGACFVHEADGERETHVCDAYVALVLLLHMQCAPMTPLFEPLQVKNQKENDAPCKISCGKVPKTNSASSVVVKNTCDACEEVILFIDAFVQVIKKPRDPEARDTLKYLVRDKRSFERMLHILANMEPTEKVEDWFAKEKKNMVRPEFENMVKRWRCNSKHYLAARKIGVYGAHTGVVCLKRMEVYQTNKSRDVLQTINATTRPLIMHIMQMAEEECASWEEIHDHLLQLTIAHHDAAAGSKKQKLEKRKLDDVAGGAGDGPEDEGGYDGSDQGGDNGEYEDEDGDQAADEEGYDGSDQPGGDHAAYEVADDTEDDDADL